MTRLKGLKAALPRGLSGRVRVLTMAGLVAAIVAVLAFTGVAQAVVRGFLRDAPVPGNDALATAAVVDASAASIDGTTAGASSETGENDVTAGDPTVWFSFTPAAAGTVYLSPSDDDPPTLRVYTGSTFPLTAVPADTDAGAVAFDVTAGTTYLLQVDGAAAPGPFDFSLIQPDAVPDGIEYPPPPSTTADGGTAPTDMTPPDVTCDPAPTGWVSDADIHCTATDSDSGLVHPEDDATFTLTADVPDGASGDDVATGTREVCDVAGNCATAGPITGLKIDRSAPVVDCAATSPNWLGAQATSDCTATDAGSGLADDSDAAFTLTTAVASGASSPAAPFSAHADVCDAVGNCTLVTPPDPAHVDLAPPLVHCAAAPAGWQSGDTTVTCTASDNGSGLADPSQETIDLNTSVGDAATATDAQTDSVTVCDRVGNCQAAGPVGGLDIDRAQPVVACTPPSGWQAGASFDIPCTASDAGSGLADSADATFALTASIPAGSQSRDAATGTRQVCDAVGNCASAGPFTVSLDDQPPVITCQHTPTDWQDATLEVQCAADDGDGSGVDADDSAFTLTADIAAGTVSDSVALAGRQVCDAVGNCAVTPDLDPGKIDRITPQVVCDQPGGAHHAEVTVTCTATDDGSGLADPSLASFTLRTSVGSGNDDSAAETDTRTVCDLAGNCTIAGPVGPFTVDRSSAPGGTAPTLDLPGVIHVLSARPETAAGVNAGGAGAVPVPFDLPRAAATPGLSARVGCNPEPGGLFPLGSTLVVCAATDDADRTTTKAFSVQVQLAPDLAPTTAYRIGAPAQARGRGFAPNTVVRIELDGTVLASVLSSGGGLVGVGVTIPPDTPPGAHTLLLRGVAPDGGPQLVVTPVTLTTDQQALAVAQPTGGTVPDNTVPDHTGTVAPPPVTTTVSAPVTTSSGPSAPATSTGAGVPTTTAPGTAPPGSSGGAGSASSSSGSPGAGPGVSVSSVSSTAGGTAGAPMTTGTVPQQTFGGGAPQTTASTPPPVTTGPPQEAGGTQQPSTPPATSAPASGGASGGLPAWLWWLLGAVALCIAAAAAVVFARRRH